MDDGKAKAAREGRPLAGLSVLIVEDTPSFQAVLAAMARALGAKVAVAATAEQGAAALARGGVDLAVVDVGLPDMSGGALLSEALLRGETAALLAVSAEHDATAAPEADMFAPKPFDSLAMFRRAAAGAMAVAATRRALDVAPAQAMGAALVEAAELFKRAAAMASTEAFDDAVASLRDTAGALGLDALAASAAALGHVADGPRAASRLATLCARAAGA